MKRKDKAQNVGTAPCLRGCAVCLRPGAKTRPTFSVKFCCHRNGTRKIARAGGRII